jgi:hypothetical protein
MYLAIVKVNGKDSCRLCSSVGDAFRWGAHYQDEIGTLDIALPPFTNYDGENLKQLRLLIHFELEGIKKASEAEVCHYCGKKLTAPRLSYFGTRYGKPAGDPDRHYPAAYCDYKCWEHEDMANQ